jgi:hypothetical protein
MQKLIQRYRQRTGEEVEPYDNAFPNLFQALA